MTDDGHGWAWFCRGLLAASSARRRPLDPDTVDRLARARAFLEERYRDELEVEELARVACYSRYHFLRLFRQAYAETPHRYLVERRMREARRLLGTTELPVTDVCLQVGFRSLGSFSRTFRDAVGEPPIAYRRRVFPSVRIQRPPIPACFLRMWTRPG